MKRFYVLFLCALIVFSFSSFVMASGNDDSGNGGNAVVTSGNDDSGNGNSDVSGDTERVRTTAEIRERVRGSEDVREVNGKFRFMFANGSEREVKVMPETASENALQRLRLRNCNESNNCTIELKEVGTGNQSRVTYEIRVEKSARFLGLFKTRMQVQADVDADNGEVLQVRKPWWAFMASETDETD